MWQMIEAIYFADEYFKMAQYVNQIGEDQGNKKLYFLIRPDQIHDFIKFSLLSVSFYLNLE